MIVDRQLSQARFERDLRGAVENPSKFAATGVTLIKVEYPTILLELEWHALSRKLLLLVEAEDWDYRPPKGTWVEADRSPKLAGIPRGGGFQLAPNVYGEQRAWFCFAGWREYHDHQSHQQPTWSSVRRPTGQPQLMRLVMQLQADLNKPGVVSNA